MARQHLRPPPRLRDGAHPVHRRRRHRRLQAAERRPLPQRRPAGRLRSSPRCRAPRPRRSRPSSPTRSRRRSTPSAASTSCARSRPRASRRSSSASSSTRTSTSPRKRCASTSRAILNDLPEGTKSPEISKLDPDAAPVLFLAVQSTRPIREVTEHADHEIRQALENISGVGQVSIVGGRKRQIQVVLDPEQAARGLAHRGRRAAGHRQPERHHARRHRRHRARRC